MLKINGVNVVQGRFPNGEVDYCRVFDFGLTTEVFRFELIFESNEDLFNLIVMKKMFDDSVCSAYHKPTILEIKFFPYSQMDRDMSSHGFSLKYVADIINDLKFDLVKICDPHSNVTPALIKHCKVEYGITTFLNCCAIHDEDYDNNYDLLFFPDNGAAKKYVEVLGCKKYRFGNKKRNLETGEIECYEVIANKEDIEGKRILIIDDICMGGRTFVEAAKALKEMGAACVELYITHMMPQSKRFYETKGDGWIDEIHTEDTLGIFKSNEVQEIEFTEDMII